MSKKGSKSSDSIYSEAFPPTTRKKQQKLSKCHTKLIDEKIDESKISYRLLNKEDIEEVFLLHREWFPVKYEREFFEVVLKEESREYYYCLASTYRTSKNEEIIIGCILVEFQSTEKKLKKHTSDDILEKISKEISFYDNMTAFICLEDYHCAYIMTLGVIDEFRRMKIASKLIEKTKEKCLEDNLNVCLFLDVITYNLSAIRFYERNGFEEVTTIKNYYKLEGEIYDSKVYVKPFTRKEKENFRGKNRSVLFSYCGYFLTYIIYVVVYILSFNFCCRCIRKKHKLD